MFLFVSYGFCSRDLSKACIGIGVMGVIFNVIALALGGYLLLNVPPTFFNHAGVYRVRKHSGSGSTVQCVVDVNFQPKPKSSLT